MNILVANDDGYDSYGLKLLVEKLSLQHDVYVIAPASNRSAVSHHITMYNENELIKIDDKTYACSGYPADCVAIGLSSDLFNVNFDCVISGINFGANLGTDIIYSGTCGAARQAVLDHVPGIAVSLDPIDWKKVSVEGWKFDAICDFVCKNLKTLISMCNTSVPKKFVNINGASIEKYKGVKITDVLCSREYDDSFKIIRSEEDSKLISKFVPGNPIPVKSKTSDTTNSIGANEITHESDSTHKYEAAESFKNNAGEVLETECHSDLDFVRNGYISVSVIYAEPLADGSLKSEINLEI